MDGSIAFSCVYPVNSTNDLLCVCCGGKPHGKPKTKTFRKTRKFGWLLNRI